MKHPREHMEVIGQDAALATLQRWAASGRLPHGLLITGPEGSGKATLAYRFAAWLLGARDEASDGGLFGESVQPSPIAVDTASPIAARIRAGTHGDLLTIEPAFDEKKGQYKDIIQVDAVRKVSEFLSQTASEADWRVAIIDAADALNPNAANAILKSLEEPPTGGMLILISHNPGRLLPTIRSRCRVLDVAPLEREAFDRVLDRQGLLASSGELARLYELSGGAPGFALRLYRDDVLAWDAMIANLQGEHAAKNEQALISADAEQHRVIGWLARRRLQEMARAEALSSDAAQQAQGHWLQQWERAEALAREAQSLYLDAKQVTAAILRSITGKVPLSERPA